MTALARHTEQEQRLAWDDYADRIRGLEGEEYLRAEQEAWDELQAVLRDLGLESATSDEQVG